MMHRPNANCRGCGVCSVCSHAPDGPSVLARLRTAQPWHPAPALAAPFTGLGPRSGHRPGLLGRVRRGHWIVLPSPLQRAYPQGVRKPAEAGWEEKHRGGRCPQGYKPWATPRFAGPRPVNRPEEGPTGEAGNRAEEGIAGEAVNRVEEVLPGQAANWSGESVRGRAGRGGTANAAFQPGGSAAGRLAVVAVVVLSLTGLAAGQSASGGPDLSPLGRLGVGHGGGVRVLDRHVRTRLGAMDQLAGSSSTAAWLGRHLGAGVLASSVQPSPWRARAERAYHRLHRFTVLWVGYAVASALLGASLAWPRRRLWRRSGLAVFAVATGALAAGSAIRWWLSDRPWYLPPMTGQFESVTAAALLGALAAGVLEWVSRRGWYALAASVFATVALLCGFTLPRAMGADIRPVQGILNNWILPLHVGVIILGYAMVAMGLVISLAYLVALARPGVRGRSGPRASGPDLCADRPEGLLAGLDRSNLVVAQLATLLIGAGTLLGAVWADYSWGRWWGFDPKETWALITFLVYVAIVHGRFWVRPSRRGLWTAGLTVAGAAGVLFNWVVVKYLLPSLHGYA